MTDTLNPAVASNGITEDEAALYDRQIRLWGVEAQNRMRTSSVLLYTLRGLSAEIAKNIVLAGVGTVTLLDDKDVVEDDLGANFFLREEDVGLKRVEAAAPRIQALNPRVNLKTCTDISLLENEDFLGSFDLIVVTEVDAPTLLKINALTRKLGKKLFAASSVGIDGWIFADLLEHEFMIDKYETVSIGEVIKVPTKIHHSYVPFSQALTHNWSKVTPRALKKTSPGIWSILTLFQTQISSPSAALTAEALNTTAGTLLPSLGVSAALLSPAVNSRIASTIGFEFPPSAAIVGGIVGQDVLNALGGKEEPVKNFMVFEGETGAGNVWSLGM